MNTIALQDWSDRAADIFRGILDEARDAGDEECCECLELQALLQEHADIKAGRPTFREQIGVLPNRRPGLDPVSHQARTDRGQAS